MKVKAISFIDRFEKAMILLCRANAKINKNHKETTLKLMEIFRPEFIDVWAQKEKWSEI